MNFGNLRVPALALGLMLLTGCASGTGGVEAVAPSGQDTIVGRAPDGGQYVLYKATGFQGGHPVVERIWTANVSRSEDMGFRWVSNPLTRYQSGGGFHLVAFAGGQSRDLGSFTNRDVKYLWAGTNTDIAGYFQDKANAAMMQTVTLQ